MERLTSINQYEDLIAWNKRSGCLTNDYLQTRADGLIAAGELWADCGNANAWLFEQKNTYWRLYYYLNDLMDAVPVTTPDGLPAVVEILYRGNGPYPQAEHDFLLACGFEDNLIRDQYAATWKDLAPETALIENVWVREAADVDEVAWACDLFNNTFDPYSGDFIPDEDHPKLLDNGQIIVAVDSQGTKFGALHQTLERNVAWISHVAVIPEARGKHMGQALIDAFVERNHTCDKSRYMLWVQQQNAPAVAMYRKKGFKYLNKSTLSMILLN